MSRFSSNDPNSGVPEELGPQPAPIEAMPIEEPRRAASLTLRQDDVREARMASMEAANRSLADALRITYRLLQVVMVGLVVLFLFSGFQQVNQSESGIRVELGKIKAEQLEPGFQFSLPYPLGEIIKIETGNRTLDIDDSFWPDVQPENRRKPIEESGAQPSALLSPARDGSLFTADSNLAHAQWSIVYTRSRPANYAKNVNPDFENAFVRSAVQRAIVHVVATLPVDDLLKPASAGEGGVQRENSVEARVRRLAQESLDRIDSGIEVSQVILRAATPPVIVRRDFNQVQIAQSNAGKVRDQALGDRSKRLNEVAGSAAQPVLDLIDRYENAVELEDAAKSGELLAAIDRLLSGESDGVNVEIFGNTYADIKTSGEVAKMISEANQFRSTVVQQAQRQAESFRAKLQQYRANPSVFLSGAMVDALQSFVSGRNVQIWWMPETTQPIDLVVSPDPDVARAMERERYERDVEGNERVKEMRESLQN